jgi:hypothetical protein
MTDLLELGALTREEDEALAAIRNQNRAAREALKASGYVVPTQNAAGAAVSERAQSRDSAHALVARAVVQLRTAMATLRDANHAADPVTHLILLDCMRDLGAVENRVKALEHAMAMQGKRA